jgi:hypothetical protein
MSGKLIAPCSLTKLFTGEKSVVSGYAIDFPEPLASIVHEYKSAIQQLQVELLSIDDPVDRRQIGRYFEKLEAAVDTLIEYSAKKH